MKRLCALKGVSQRFAAPIPSYLPEPGECCRFVAAKTVPVDDRATWEWAVETI